MNLYLWIAFGLFLGIIGAITIAVLGTISAGYTANILNGIEFSGFKTSALIIGVAGSLGLVSLSKLLMRIE